MKECIIEANHEGKGWYLHFVDFNNLRAEISSKKRGQQKKSTLK